MIPLRALVGRRGLLSLAASAADTGRPRSSSMPVSTRLRERPARQRQPRRSREKGALRYQRSIGFATIDNGVPRTGRRGHALSHRPGVRAIYRGADHAAAWRTASITLDSRLAEFFPDLPNALDITYRDLLSASQRPG